MRHFASSDFWEAYRRLPEHIQDLADANYRLLKMDPSHPSLRFKKISQYWSVRIGLHYRALAIGVQEGMLWFWIGNHAEYDKILRG